MKRVILIVAALAMGISLIGCGEDTSQASTSSQGPKVPPGQSNVGGNEDGGNGAINPN